MRQTMKIKLSRTQWQRIGKKAGWIKTSDWLLSEDKTKILLSIFDALPGKLTKTEKVTSYSKEIHDEALGMVYIQIYFNSDENAMGIEKYYENEFLQEDYGQSRLIPVNWQNPQETVKQIKFLIEKWL